MTKKGTIKLPKIATASCEKNLKTDLEKSEPIEEDSHDMSKDKD